MFTEVITVSFKLAVFKGHSWSGVSLTARNMKPVTCMRNVLTSDLSSVQGGTGSGTKDAVSVAVSCSCQNRVASMQVLWRYVLAWMGAAAIMNVYFSRWVAGCRI